ncbi:glucokinase [Hansschlegelia beijingensis]
MAEARAGDLLVGDVGGTNCRFGLVQPGALRVTSIETMKDDRFAAFEEAVAAYLEMTGASFAAAFAGGLLL